MTHLRDDDARSLRDTVMLLELPQLTPDAFERIAARRASGERVSLRTTDVAPAHTRRDAILSVSLAAAAALVIATLVSRRSGVVTAANTFDHFALASADSACANFSTTRDSSSSTHSTSSSAAERSDCGPHLIPRIGMATVGT